MISLSQQLNGASKLPSDMGEWTGKCLKCALKGCKYLISDPIRELEQLVSRLVSGGMFG